MYAALSHVPQTIHHCSTRKTKSDTLRTVATRASRRSSSKAEDALEALTSKRFSGALDQYEWCNVHSELSGMRKRHNLDA